LRIVILLATESGTEKYFSESGLRRRYFVAIAWTQSLFLKMRSHNAA
jgi:hypothetical protein